MACPYLLECSSCQHTSLYLLAESRGLLICYFVSEYQPVMSITTNCALQSTLQLSVSQVNDLMLVRQLYVTKRQLASQKRAQLMAQLQEEDLNPIDDAVNVAELGAELQKNACEEHRMLHSVAIVIYCGVSPPFILLAVYSIAESSFPRRHANLPNASAVQA